MVNHSYLIIIISNAIKSVLFIKGMMPDFVLPNKNSENPIITHEHVPLVLSNYFYRPIQRWSQL